MRTTETHRLLTLLKVALFSDASAAELIPCHRPACGTVIPVPVLPGDRSLLHSDPVTADQLLVLAHLLGVPHGRT